MKTDYLALVNMLGQTGTKFSTWAIQYHGDNDERMDPPGTTVVIENEHTDDVFTEFVFNAEGKLLSAIVADFSQDEE